MSNTYDTQLAATRQPDGRFGKGSPGRPFGSRNGSSQKAMRAILDDFHRNQDEVLSNLRDEDPVEYIRTITRLLPKHVEAEPLVQVDDWADDMIDLAFKEARRVLGAEQDPRAAMKRLEALLTRPPQI